MPIDIAGKIGDINDGETPASAATAPDAAAPSQPPSPAPAEPSSPTASQSPEGQPAAATGGQSQSSWSLRQELAKAGLQPEQFPDDQAAWRYVEQQMAVRAQEQQQLRDVAQWGYYYQQNRADIEAALQAYRASKQQASAPAQQASDWWNPPQWNEADLQGLERDEKGNLRVIPGYAPDLVQRYQTYQRWQAEKLASFMRDPIGTIKPGLEKTFSEMVEKAVEERLRRYDDNNFAASYVGQQDWLFEKDVNGRKLIDRAGQPVLSPAGQRFLGYVQFAQQSLGITDTRQQQQYAQQMTELEALRLAYRQQQGGAAAAGGGLPAAAGAQTPEQINKQLKDAALNGAGRLPSGGGASPPPPPADQSKPRPRSSFGARLRESLKQGGVKDVV